MRLVCVTMRVGTDSIPRMSTSVHWHPTFISRMNSARITFIPLTSTEYREVCAFGRAPSVIHASGVRRMFVKYYTVFARMCRRARYFIDLSVIVNDTCAVYAWFMRDSSVISIPDTRIIWSLSRRTSTHKRIMCVICEWFVRDRLCHRPFRQHILTAHRANGSEVVHLNYTFDFSHNVCLPLHERQMGPVYFASPQKVHIFGG